jgi:hypothetical protein
MTCPKCANANLRDITDQDDTVRVLFCGFCSYQGSVFEFEAQPQTDEEEQHTTDEQPSALRKVIHFLQGR